MLLLFLQQGNDTLENFLNLYGNPFLYSRWRLFRRPIVATPDHVIMFAKAAIGLHNYLWTTDSSVYCPPGFVDGEDRTGHVLQGGWKRDNEACTSMQAVSQTVSNRQVLIPCYDIVYLLCIIPILV